MVEFSLWDILRNLLLALRWTVALSAIAFVGGGPRTGCAPDVHQDFRPRLAADD